MAGAPELIARSVSDYIAIAQACAPLPLLPLSDSTRLVRGLKLQLKSFVIISLDFSNEFPPFPGVSCQACATRRGRVRVGEMRRRLLESRATSPLFDISRYASDYERLLHIAWDAYEATTMATGGGSVGSSSGEGRGSRAGNGGNQSRRKEFHTVVSSS